MKYNKINIFFDTNKLECRFNDKMFLDDIIFNNEFEEVLEYVGQNENIKIYIPEIVWEEILNHLIEEYKKSERSFNDIINNYKKSFGTLIDIKYVNTIKNYEEYIREKSKEFKKKYENKVEIAYHNKHEEKFKSIISNLIKKRAPFTATKGNGKNYSDAGFKDMLIVETIVDTCKHNEIGVLYTNDRDFAKAFRYYEEGKYLVKNEMNDLKTFLSATENKFSEKNIRKKFTKDEYLIETLFHHLDLKRENCLEHTVKNIEEDEESHLVTIEATFKKKKYDISVQYDYVANEIIDAELRDKIEKMDEI